MENKYVFQRAFIKFLAYVNAFGFYGFLNCCAYLFFQYTSALTHNISGTAKACAQTILATHWYQESRSLLWWFSNFIVLFGSAGYARMKQIEMETKHKVNQLLQKV